jgi:hypothetical protein
MMNTLVRKLWYPQLWMIVLMLLMGCDSSQWMKDYYTTNQDSLVQIRTLSQTLADNYAFLKVTIRKKSGELELMFHGGSRDNVTMYLNPGNLSLISEHVVDGCDPAVLQRFRTMYQDDDLREILSLFEATEPKAIRISHGGVFAALGETLKSPNPNLEGGILMTFEPEQNNRIVEQIDTNVYLYDDLVY